MKQRYRNKSRYTERREQAKDRQDVYDKLTIQERIKTLDARLGVGVGAARERAKLQKLAQQAVEKPSKKSKANKI